MATMQSPAIRWDGSILRLLDQRALPGRIDWLAIDNADDCADAIARMVVRGAPAIGISAAYGLVLAARQLGDNASEAALENAFSVLANSRPTAVNLFWALARMREVAATASGAALCDALEREAVALHDDDLQMNRRLADHGQALLPQGCQVYTHCNTGALATGGHGTALGIIRSAWAGGRISGVIAGETRPWLQGARLTAWELMQDGIPVTLVVDSAAAHLMASGRIGAVVVGADRITANGDTANKIGTYGLAVLARHHDIPFIVAAPVSTLDPDTATGADIEIEQRDPAEITRIQGQTLAPDGVAAENPAFDVTPAPLISAIVTERGVIERPDADKIRAHLMATTT